MYSDDVMHGAFVIGKVLRITVKCETIVQMANKITLIVCMQNKLSKLLLDLISETAICELADASLQSGLGGS